MGVAEGVEVGFEEGVEVGVEVGVGVVTEGVMAVFCSLNNKAFLLGLPLRLGAGVSADAELFSSGCLRPEPVVLFP